MSRKLHCALLGIALFGFYGCTHKSAKLQKSVVPPDKTLFETGSDYLKKGRFIQARLTFQTLINTYPDSEMAAEAHYAIADSYYDEGGTENLLQAEAQYKDFIIFFPASSKAPDAQLKVITSAMKSMQSPERDQQNTDKAELEAKSFINKFPNHDYMPIVRKYLTEIQENRAMANLKIGQFYADKGNYDGAYLRFQNNVDKYQDFSIMDENLFRLAEAQRRLNKLDEAAANFAKVVEGFPYSKYFELAKEQLKQLDKPVPSVNNELAALHRSRLKPDEGFNPARLFVDIGKGLGFVGTPDRYKIAQQSAAEEKARNAEKEATKAGDGEQSSDDILIKTILKKPASGQTTATTTIGPDSESSQLNADDKKKKKEKEKEKKIKPRRRNKNVKKPS